MTFYLYVKTHNITGLKYLGQTKKEDPYSYTGSGLYWIRHLKKYGNDCQTEILRECSSKDEVREWGIYYSNLWNVVESKEWANLKPESGDGSSGYKHREDTKRRISESNKGHTVSEETRKKIGITNSKKTRSEETRKQISKTLTGRVIGPHSETRRKNISESLKGHVVTPEAREIISSKLKGKTFISNEGRERISKAHTGKIVSEETRQKLSAANKGNKSRLGMTTTEETKRKMSEAQLGKPKNHGAAVSMAKKGKPWPEARRAAQRRRTSN